jgi:hypothetical protein
MSKAGKGGRSSGIALSYEVQRKRIFESKQLQMAMRGLQKRYYLPLPGWKAVHDFQGPSQSIVVDKVTRKKALAPQTKRHNQFWEDMKELARRFGVPDNFLWDMWQYLVIGEITHDTHGAVGFPVLHVDFREKTKSFGADYSKEKMVITPETDIDNPEVLSSIREWQRRTRGTPPKPQPMEDNSRKLDWRPVWEWGKRHPSVTRNEIARMLDRDPVYVRRKLEELDAEVEDDN